MAAWDELAQGDQLRLLNGAPAPMWPFTRRRKAPVDLLTDDVDLARLAPFREVERYLLVWRNAMAHSYGLAVVYECRSGERVHVVHSPGSDHGGAMQTHGEWLATEVRQRDDAAAAIFLVWPRQERFSGTTEAELIRVWFVPNPSGAASPREVVLMSEGEDGSPRVDNVFAKSTECLYQDIVFGTPRQGPEHWAQVLGCAIPTYTEAEWVAAADLVDPGRVQRASVEQDSQDAFDGMKAWMKEMGVYGDEPVDVAQESDHVPSEPSQAQKDRVARVWATEPEAPTFLVGSYGIGGANNGDHVVPVVSLVLPSERDEDGMVIDLADFHGADVPPPKGRRIRLWDETLLSVEQIGQWRVIVYLDQDLFPSWWFTAAAAPGDERPHGIVAVLVGDENRPQDGEPTALDDLGDGVGLAHLEDCREL